MQDCKHLDWTKHVVWTKIIFRCKWSLILNWTSRKTLKLLPSVRSHHWWRALPGMRDPSYMLSRQALNIMSRPLLEIMVRNHDLSQTMTQLGSVCLEGMDMAKNGMENFGTFCHCHCVFFQKKSRPKRNKKCWSTHSQMDKVAAPSKH